jgi:hypothetical protein
MTDKQLDTLLPHQQRVVQEKKELDEKVVALAKFFTTDTFHNLSANEQTMLHRQIIVMGKYSQILGDRIALFLKEVNG